MIILDQNQIIAAGQVRTCYLLPDTPDRIIKIPHTNATIDNPENLKELKMFHYLSKKHDRLDIVSKPFGFEETNLGFGLVCECIRDASGEISKPLQRTLGIEDKYPFEKVRKAVHLFCDELIRKNIQLFDLNILNILIQIQPDASFKAISSDLKGRYDNKEFIPFSTYIPFFSRQKLTRRSKKLLARIENLHHQATGKS